MNVIVKGLQAALALIETNGWWDGHRQRRATNGSDNARLQAMCVVTATYWAEIDSYETRQYHERDLQFPLWNALPYGCRTDRGRTADLIAFNDSQGEAEVKALFARAIAAEIAKSCTT